MNDMQLRYILKLAEVGSLNKAANHCGTTYQTLAYQIENFEAELKTTLFNRTKIGCKLTEEGSLVIQFAKQTLDNYENLKRNVKKYREIRLGIDIRYIPPDLLEFASLKSMTTLSIIPINYNDLRQELEFENIDCYIGYDRGFHDSISFVPLLKDQVGIVVQSSSPLSLESKIKYSDFPGMTIQIGKFIWDRRDKVLDMIRSASKNITIASEAVDAIAIAEIYNGNSVAIMPCGYSFIFNENVKVVPLEDETIEYGIYYTSKKDKATNLANTIREFLEQHSKIRECEKKSVN